MPTNHPPSASAGPDLRAGIGQEITLDGTASFDPDGDSIALLWTQTAGPPVTLSGTAAVKPTFVGTEPASYSFTLTVTDSNAAQATDTVAVVLDFALHVTVTAPATGERISATAIDYRLIWKAATSTTTPIWRVILRHPDGTFFRDYQLLTDFTHPNTWGAAWSPSATSPAPPGSYILEVREDVGGISGKANIVLN